MRREEEILDACIALGAFVLLLLLYLCIVQWKSITSCCNSVCDCLCCRCAAQEDLPVYDDLNQLLFDADDTRGGLLVEDDDNDYQGEINVGNFFCNVLDEKPRRRSREERERREIGAEDQNASRFSEPLL